VSSDDMSMLTVDVWTKRHRVKRGCGDWIRVCGACSSSPRRWSSSTSPSTRRSLLCCPTTSPTSG